MNHNEFTTTIEVATDLSERFIKLRKALGYQSQSEMARALGVKQPTISLIEKQGKTIPRSLVLLLLERHRVNSIWLMTGAGEMFLSSTDEVGAVNSGLSAVPIEGAITPRVTFVPFVELEAQAGYAMQIGDSVFMGRLPKKAVYAEGIKDGDFAWQITGDSMEPVFMDGDIVLCSGHDLINDLALISTKSYYIVVATDTDGSNWSGAMLKKVAIKGDTLELMSLNKDVAVIKLPAVKLKHVYKVKKLVDRVL